jgi:hypothetical protein
MESHNQEAILKRIIKLRFTLIVLAVLFFFTSAVFGDEAGMKEKYQKAMEDLKYFKDAILDYLVDNTNAPRAKTMAELIRQDVGNGLSFTVFYLEQIPEDQVPLKDPWGNEFLYKHDKRRFWIASAGSDGKFDGFDQTGAYPDSEDELEGKDVIVSNNGFLVFPLDDTLRRALRDSFEIIFTTLPGIF